NNGQGHRSVLTTSVGWRPRVAIQYSRSVNVPPGSAPRSPLALLSVLSGLGLAAAAWMLPNNRKSLPPALLAEAGRGTPSGPDLGRELVAAEKIGPAQLVLAAARTLEAPGAAALAAAVDGLAAHQAELVAWGGWDPFLE